MNQQLVLEIQKMQNGNFNDYNNFYNLTINDVYSVISQYTKDQNIANEIVQNTYNRMYQEIGSLTNYDAFDMWAGNIARQESMKKVGAPKVQPGMIPQQNNMQQSMMPQQNNMQPGMMPQQNNMQPGMMPQQEKQASENTNSKKGMPIGVIIAIAVGAAFVIGGLIFLIVHLVGNKKGDKQDSTTEAIVTTAEEVTTLDGDGMTSTVDSTTEADTTMQNDMNSKENRYAAYYFEAAKLQQEAPAIVDLSGYLGTRGFSFAKVVDFNNDGNDVLITVSSEEKYVADGDYSKTVYYYTVYSYQDGQTVQLCRNEIMDKIYNVNIGFLKEGDKTYLVEYTGDADCFYDGGYEKDGSCHLVVQEFNGKGFTPVSTYTTSWVCKNFENGTAWDADFTYSIDGVTVSDEEYYTRESELTGKCDNYYFYAGAQDVDYSLTRIGAAMLLEKYKTMDMLSSYIDLVNVLDYKSAYKTAIDDELKYNDNYFVYDGYIKADINGDNIPDVIERKRYNEMDRKIFTLYTCNKYGDMIKVTLDGYAGTNSEIKYTSPMGTIKIYTPYDYGDPQELYWKAEDSVVYFLGEKNWSNYWYGKDANVADYWDRSRFDCDENTFRNKVAEVYNESDAVNVNELQPISYDELINGL